MKVVRRMHDIKKIRADVAAFKVNLLKRGRDFAEIDEIIEVDAKRRTLIENVESLKAERNLTTRKIGDMRRQGINNEEVKSLVTEMEEIGKKIKEIDENVLLLDEKIKTVLESLPNVPHENVPIGANESENVLVREWGTPKDAPLAHWEIGSKLDILDFERSAKITGSRSIVLKGLGARLERALISFLMDIHVTKHGYKEIATPYIVNRDSMYGTGQLPKFENDAYLTKEGKHFLIPTTEVPLVNLHRDEVIPVEELPISYVGHSANFRKEAGSAGRDTKGILRLHQFKKVELVKFTLPEESYDALEQLTHDAERILQELVIPYRVVELCTGDLGFAATKTYDIEAWMPKSGGYREISSCSNCGDFQGRRAKIKFKRDKKAKLEYVHTLNGTGVAIERLIIAVIENYQNEDGNIVVPEVLIPYMGGITIIK